MDFIIIPVRKNVGLEFLHIYNGLVDTRHEDLAKFYYSFVTVAESISKSNPYIELDSSLFDKIKSSDKGSKGDI